MCGILALLTPQNNRERAIGYSQPMLLPLKESRGPDASATLDITSDIQGPYSVIMNHARLSIIDLSEQANQPMRDPESGITLIFNGEIYNFKDLRDRLKSHHTFKTQSDSEVLLAGLKIWGLEKTLEHLRGMFAFVAFDPRTQEIFAARDRAGEKPLSFGQVGEDWVFTSDLRVLNFHPDWSREISLKELKTYFQYRFVPHPRSLYKGFNKLSPGCFLRLPLKKGGIPLIKAYWSLEKEWESSTKTNNESLRETLSSVVERTTLASDVAVGCFLSGGVDSSLVAAIASKKVQEPMTAYTLQFTEKDFDESEQAQAVAKALKMKHILVPFGIEDFKKSFLELNHFLDEPVAVHSFYPLGVLAKRAKQDIKVCLSGDGGDELFAGYNRYLFWHKYMEKLQKWPASVRKIAASLLQAPAFGQGIRSLLYYSGKKQIDIQFEKILEALKTESLADYYNNLLSQKPNPLGENVSMDFNLSNNSTRLSDIDKMMTMDFQFYLPGDVLNKVDRATMAYGLEARAPLLDLDVIQAAGQVPMNQKIDSHGGKEILKKWLKELLPEINFNTAKTGFTTPLERWAPQLFDQDYYKRLIDSDLYPYFNNDFKPFVIKQSLSAQSCFTLDCVINWLTHYQLKICDDRNQINADPWRSL